MARSYPHRVHRACGLQREGSIFRYDSPRYHTHSMADTTDS